MNRLMSIVRAPSFKAAGFGLLALLVLGSASAVVTPASAQVTSGKITGVVLDVQTAQPLPGAQVYLEGTGVGALTAENGRYFIINVAPATYIVVVELIGYQTVRTENVVVFIDATKTLDFDLTPQAIAIEEVRVQIERTPLVELNARGSQALISSQQLEALPVNTIEQALSLKQGFFMVPDNENILAFNEKSRGITAIRIRGGRNGETSTLIDGIPINNFIFGGPAISLTKVAVGQIEFLKGFFSPEYGNALSGIVNIATREPGTQIEGSFEYQTSEIAGAFGSDPDDLRGFRFLEGYVAGPIPATADKLRFLFAGRARYGAERVLQFDDDVFDPSNPPTGFNIPNVRDVFAGWRAFGYDDDQQVFGKLTYAFTPSTKLSVMLLNDRRQFQRFDFDFLLAGFDPQSAPIVDSAEDSLFFQALEAGAPFEDLALGSLDSNRTLFVAKFGQVFGRSALNVNFGLFNQERRNCNFFEGVCLEDAFADINFTSDRFVAPGITAEHPTTGTDQFFGGEKITTFVLRGDLQSQVTDHHSLQVGVFADFHDLEFSEKRNLGANDVFIVDQRYTTTPWDAAAYIQDLIEFDFLTLDLGVRFDFGQAGGLFFVDPLDPTNGTTAREVCEDPARFGADPTLFTGLLACSQPAVRDSGAIIAAADDFQQSETRVQISPRIGVSFPVTAYTSVFFNYSINTQNPLLNNIFQNTSIGTVGEAVPCGLPGVARDAASNAECGPIIFSDQFAIPFLGNPNLEIERTSNYEAGVIAEIGDDYAVAVTLFNKDQFGLTGIRQGGLGIQDIGATYGSSSPNYQVLVNQDYQTVRGLEFDFQRRLSNFWAFDVNYSFSSARTNAAPPEREFESRAAQFDPAIREEIRSEIDIPHRFNGTFVFQAGADAPDIEIGALNVGDILKHSLFSLTFQAQSGIPYTPTTNFFGGLSAAGNAVNQLERFSGSGPPSWVLNLRASKGFNLSNMVYSLFVQVENLTDKQNCFQPLPTTGRCDGGSNDQARSRQGNVVTEAATSTFFDRPQLFGPRRSVNIGLRMSF